MNFGNQSIALIGLAALAMLGALLLQPPHSPPLDQAALIFSPDTAQLGFAVDAIGDVARIAERKIVTAEEIRSLSAESQAFPVNQEVQSWVEIIDRVGAYRRARDWVNRLTVARRVS